MIDPIMALSSDFFDLLDVDFQNHILEQMCVLMKKISSDIKSYNIRSSEVLGIYKKLHFVHVKCFGTHKDNALYTKMVKEVEITIGVVKARMEGLFSFDAIIKQSGCISHNLFYQNILKLNH